MRKKMSSKVAIFMTLIFTLILGVNSFQVKAEENFQKELFQAISKSYDITSLESSSNTSIKVNLSDFDESIQAVLDMYAPLFQNITIKTNVKSNISEAKNSGKSQIDFVLNAAGNEIPFSLWSDFDFSKDELKNKSVVGLPSMVTQNLAILFPEFANKQYLVIDYSTMEELFKGNPELEESGVNFDFSKLSTIVNKYMPQFIELTQKYMEQYKPPVDYVAYKGITQVQYADGTKFPVKVYKINLNDEEFKTLIRYTINNLLEFKEGADVLKAYMTDIMNLVEAPDKDEAVTEMTGIFDEIETKLPEFKQNFNDFMDNLNDVKILGDKGLTSVYYVNEEGFLTGSHNSMDITIDLSEVDKLINMFKEEVEVKDEEAEVQNEKVEAKDESVNDANIVNSKKLKGIISVEINSSTINSNINGDVKIDIPETNEDNSIDYFQFILGIAKTSR